MIVISRMSFLSDSSAMSLPATRAYRGPFYALLAILLMGAAFWLGKLSVAGSGAEAVQTVLQQFQALDQEFTKATPEKKITGPEMVAVADRMKRIDISACPPDFREAFIRLAGEFWLTGEVMKQYSDMTSVAIDAGLNLLAGEKDAGIAGMKKELNAAVRALIVRQTEMEAIAVRHGARLLHD